MTKIGIILGSTRSGRRGQAVAERVSAVAAEQEGDATFESAAGFVGYGLHGGTRAVGQLRLVLAEMQFATVRSQVVLSVFNDFEITDPTQTGTFVPGPHHEPALVALLGEVVAWSKALEPLRAPALA